MPRKGKYAEWRTPDGLLRLEGFARDGLSDEQIAKKMGIGVSTYYEWQNRFQDIAEAIKKGKAPVDIQVENALLKRALGYTYTEVTEEYSRPPRPGEKLPPKSVKRVVKEMPPDVAALIFWLKNRRPQYWKDKPEVEAQQEALAKLDKLLEGIGNAAK